jgi:formate hydrogenlyase subunit 4
MIALQVLLIVACAPFVQGAMKRLRARLQHRPGPSVWQPYRDLRKLWSKDAVLPEGISWITACTPGVSLGVALTFAAAVPLIAQPPAFLDVVALMFLLALGRWMIAIAALDTRSGFAAMAASREMTLSALTEPALLLALLGARSSAASFLVPHGNLSVAGLVALLAFSIVTVAETARIPIDNQETHYELTMIHEGQTLEYSGWHLALLHLASYVRQFAFLTIAAGLIAPSPVAALLGAGVLAVLFTFIENALARLRLFEIPQLLVTGMLLAVVSVAVRVVPT